MASIKDYKKLDEEILDDKLESLEEDLKQEYNLRLDNIEDRIKRIYEEFENDEGNVEYSLIVGTLFLNLFQDEVDKSIDEISSIKESKINNFFNEVYTDGFNGNKEILSKATDKNLNNISTNEQNKQEIINQKLGGASTKARLERDKNNTKFNSKQKVENSIKDGKTYSQTTEELKDTLNKDFNSFMTIAETKGHTIAEESKKAFASAVVSSNIDLTPIKIWNTVGDEKVRAAHNQANTQERELDEDFYVGGEYLNFPGDPKGRPNNIINCRCFLLYDFK